MSKHRTTEVHEPMYHVPESQAPQTCTLASAQPEAKKYRRTLVACYLGFVTQSIAANFAPLLFLTFQLTYGVSLEQVALIPVIFYLTQMFVDLASTKVADKIGYRTCVVFSQVVSTAGLVMLAVLPEIPPVPFVGILIAVVFYATGSGLVEEGESLPIRKLLRIPLIWLMIILMICAGASDIHGAMGIRLCGISLGRVQNRRRLGWPLHVRVLGTCRRLWRHGEPCCRRRNFPACRRRPEDGPTCSNRVPTTASHLLVHPQEKIHH